MSAQPLQALYEEHRTIAALRDATQHLARTVQRCTRVDVRVSRWIRFHLDVFAEQDRRLRH